MIPKKTNYNLILELPWMLRVKCQGFFDAGEYTIADKDGQRWELRVKRENAPLEEEDTDEEEHRSWEAVE